jgi:hypothetical protein
MTSLFTVIITDDRSAINGFVLKVGPKLRAKWAPRMPVGAARRIRLSNERASERKSENERGERERERERGRRQRERREERERRERE